jgi:hypothetical protein
MAARNRVVFPSIALMLLSSISYAQQELTGTYTGQYKYKVKSVQTGEMKLEITSVNNGVVAGKLTEVGECNGDYSVSGKYEKDKFALQRGPGTMAGCGNEDMVLKAVDGKLVGRIGKHHVEMSK